MLSVIISTGSDERKAVATLAALVAGAAAGLVRDVVLADWSRSPALERVADIAGCRYFGCDGPAAAALSAGAQQVRGPWLLFLHAGAVLDAGWIDEAMAFLAAVSPERPRAAMFSYGRSHHLEESIAARLVRRLRMLWGPQPDQGLLIAREHFDGLGGFGADARGEAKLLRRLGGSLMRLRTRIVVG